MTNEEFDTRLQKLAALARELRVDTTEGLANDLLASMRLDDPKWWERVNYCITSAEERLDGDARPAWLDELEALAEQEPRRRPHLTLIAGGNDRQ